jgi:hypothetical protein
MGISISGYSPDPHFEPEASDNAKPAINVPMARVIHASNRKFGIVNKDQVMFARHVLVFLL